LFDVRWQEAIQKNSFHLWPIPGMGRVNIGDATVAFESCDFVISDEVQIGGQEHFYMETHNVRVVPKGEDGEFDVYVGSQWPAFIQVCHSYHLSRVVTDIIYSGLS